MGQAYFYTYKGRLYKRLAATQVSISRSDWVLTYSVAASSDGKSLGGNTTHLSLPLSNTVNWEVEQK